jgi:hypothetical protein
MAHALATILLINRKTMLALGSQAYAIVKLQRRLQLVRLDRYLSGFSIAAIQFGTCGGKALGIKGRLLDGKRAICRLARHPQRVHIRLLEAHAAQAQRSRAAGGMACGMETLNCWAGSRCL